ncbi:hypothetical protein ACFQBQ_00695 [Granulicella cerasi]|uniref:Uncharacterized protein n=1 Tax=Granulicella cerasi TaxID=741063 RepID=A0ABW1Z551_9BACT|nr:hypothetical protein [Granulicella cerasi]
MPSLELITHLTEVIIVPVVGWLATTILGLIKKTDLLELKFRDNLKDVDKLLTTQELSGTRLTKVEEAVINLEKLSERNNSQFALIMQKLEQLPRCIALLESYSNSIEHMVPRLEVEARLKNTEERIRSLEDKREAFEERRTEERRKS